MREERPRLETENPELPITEKSRIIAERWRDLDEESKQPYMREAEEAKRKYEEEMGLHEREFGKMSKVKKIRKG